MKIISLIFLFVIFNSSDLIPIKHFPAKAEIVLSNTLGNIYSVNENNLILYNNEGQKLFSYSNSFLGNISFVDVSDPMRILLYFKDFNKVVFLSNKLTEIGSPIELDNAGYSQVSACCTSNSGGFWIFDSQKFQLIRLNNNLVADREGTIIQSIYNKSENIAVKLIEESDQIYMSIPQIGILIFDKFGVYKKTIPLIGIKYFQIIGDKIIYLSENKLCSYSLTNNAEIQTIQLDLKIKSVSVYKNLLIALSDDEIFIYNL
jgi:hypothetical protein